MSCGRLLNHLQITHYCEPHKIRRHDSHTFEDGEVHVAVRFLFQYNVKVFAIRIPSIRLHTRAHLAFELRHFKRLSESQILTAIWKRQRIIGIPKEFRTEWDALRMNVDLFLDDVYSGKISMHPKPGWRWAAAGSQF